MSKPWFLDHMADALVPSRMREACRLMELDARLTDFIMARFAHKQGMYGAEHTGFDEFTQRKMMPKLDDKVRGWAEANPSFFKFIELRTITRYYDRRT